MSSERTGDPLGDLMDPRCTCVVEYECVAHGSECDGQTDDCCVGRTADSAPFPVGIVPGVHLPGCPLFVRKADDPVPF